VQKEQQSGVVESELSKREMIIHLLQPGFLVTLCLLSICRLPLPVQTLHSTCIIQAMHFKATYTHNDCLCQPLDAQQVLKALTYLYSP